MKEILNVYSISGFHYELYYPDNSAFSCEPIDVSQENPLRRINSMFWADLLSKSNLERLICRIQDSQKHSTEISFIEEAVLANPNLFISLVEKASINIINQAISEREMFAYMEQIEIACKLFSKYLYPPFTLSIQDGFEEPSLCASALVETITDKSKNPYWDFLEQYVFSAIDGLHPKLIWINGQPKTSSLTIASYIKNNNPAAVIAVRYHSSEYFSLNKIDDLLVHNKALFSIVDCIVLDDNTETCAEIEQAVLKGESFAECRNIIYRDRISGDIIKTVMKQVDYSFEECTNIRPQDSRSDVYYISPHSVMNLKLNPNTACYWNKCSFCGINKKYKFITNNETIDMISKIRHIENYIKQGVKYLWFEDEAVPPTDLESFANEVINHNLKIFWQIRSRIDNGFTESLVKKLYRAGLREIRFGLESATFRILSLMNKFPADVSLELVESLVRSFTTNGIHVHFPMIVGFPTETAQERIETYSFLIYLKEKYKHVSFNINVLMLDVSSDLFKHFAKYGVSQLSFPCSPYDFVGNMVSFFCPTMDEKKESIDIKRNEFMREVLYPWLPATALIKPNIFYRLTETIRNTLVWHCKPETIIDDKEDLKKYRKATTFSAWKSKQGQQMVYDWTTHILFSFSQVDFNRFIAIDQLSRDVIIEDPFYKALVDRNLLVLDNTIGGGK